MQAVCLFYFLSSLSESSCSSSSLMKLMPSSMGVLLLMIRLCKICFFNAVSHYLVIFTFLFGMFYLRIKIKSAPKISFTNLGCTLYFLYLLHINFFCINLFQIFYCFVKKHYMQPYI